MFEPSALAGTRGVWPSGEQYLNSCTVKNIRIRTWCTYVQEFSPHWSLPLTAAFSRFLYMERSADLEPDKVCLTVGPLLCVSLGPAMELHRCTSLQKVRHTVDRLWMYCSFVCWKCRQSTASLIGFGPLHLDCVLLNILLIGKSGKRFLSYKIAVKFSPATCLLPSFWGDFMTHTYYTMWTCLSRMLRFCEF